MVFAVHHFLIRFLLCSSRFKASNSVLFAEECAAIIRETKNPRPMKNSVGVISLEFYSPWRRSSLWRKPISYPPLPAIRFSHRHQALPKKVLRGLLHRRLRLLHGLRLHGSALHAHGPGHRRTALLDPTRRHSAHTRIEARRTHGSLALHRHLRRGCRRLHPNWHPSALGEDVLHRHHKFSSRRSGICGARAPRSVFWGRRAWRRYRLKHHRHRASPT
jgi:hypothetical protein